MGYENQRLRTRVFPQFPTACFPNTQLLLEGEII